MYDSKSQPAGAAALEARIERIRQGLAAQQARLARGSMLTASVGAILCAGMAFWFYYGYEKIKEVSTPKVLVDAAETYVMDALPKARAALETRINENADDWAADISKQVQDNVPDVRRKLEDFIAAKSAEKIDEFQLLSAKQFRSFVETNQALLNDGFRSLKKPDEAERFVQDLHAAVESQLASDMKTQSEDMLHTLIDLNAKIDVLSKGEKLNHEQALEREILAIARRLQVDSQSEQAPDSGTGERPTAKRRAKRTASTVEGALGEVPAVQSPDAAKESATPAGDAESK